MSGWNTLNAPEVAELDAQRTAALALGAKQ